MDDEPFVLPATRGFLRTLESVDGTRGVDSFITILAWISSSLEAFTFLGQNSVTNLTARSITAYLDLEALKMTYVHKCFLHLSVSSPAEALFCNTDSIRRPIAAKESLSIATLSSLGISSPDSLSCFCDRVKNGASEMNRQAITNCFFTGLSSSLVAASSIDGLENAAINLGDDPLAMVKEQTIHPKTQSQ